MVDQQSTQQDKPSPSIVTAVFRPVQSIKWPKLCLGCCAANPQQTLKLDVFPATKTSSATKAGGLVGGLAFGVAGAVGGEASSFQIPICTACQTRLPRKEIEALGNHKYSFLPSSHLVDTEVVTLEISVWCVVLTFKNAAFGIAFRAANEGRAFDTVEECRAAKPSEQTKPAEKKQPRRIQCKGCGESILGSDWTCPHCGRTLWSSIFGFSVFAALLISIGVFICEPGGWRWLWIIIGGLFGLIPITETVKSFTWSKKPK